MQTILQQLRAVLSFRAIAIAVSALSLAACGGGGDGGGAPGGGNSAPSPNAGPDQTVSESTAVNLNGSGTDSDGDPLTYTWTQTAGQAVAISNANSPTANFMAPDVLPGTPEVLTFQLEVHDGTTSRTDTVNITVQEGQTTVRISGTAAYEFVPPAAGCRGLDFAATSSRPIRGATVQLIDSNTDNVLQSTSSGSNGAFSFAGVASNTMVRLRVRAELKQAGTPNWDVEIRDNVDTGATPPPLAARPLYVLDGADFDSTGADLNRDLTATTGWGGSSYTGPRAAAPFAILDAIYSAVQFVLAVDPNASFAPLDAFWSVNNTSAIGGDIDAGDLGASFYRGDIDSLFLVGEASTDTEEFDDHVIVHEWGHYFEDNFSRSDSIGGAHALGQSVDARLAFGEGWATAIAAMALNNPQYCDTFAAGSTGGFGINAESDGFGLQGWYNELSVTTFLYDLWDSNADGSDNDSIGFGPIYATMMGPQAVTPAWTSIFSFASELRPMLNATEQSFLDSQLTRENINPNGLDIWATAETNAANGARDELPLYVDIAADGGTTNVCTNSDYDNARDGNKLAEYRFVRLSVPATATYNVVIATTTATPVTADPADRDQSDPDMYIYRNGAFVARGISGVDNLETFTTPTLVAGQTYTADLRDFRFADEEGAPATYPEQICFDVSFSASP